MQQAIYRIGFLGILMLGMWVGQAKAQYTIRAYKLEVQVDPERKRIAGTQQMFVRAEEKLLRIPVRLQAGLLVRHVRQSGRDLTFTREGDTLWATLSRPMNPSDTTVLQILYGGEPQSHLPMWQAEQAIFDASVLPSHHWFPTHIDPAYQVEEMRMAVILHERLTLQTNARYLFQTDRPGPFVRRQYLYAYPLSAQDVSLYVGQFEKLTDTYAGAAGSTEISLLVSRDNLDRGRAAFAQLLRMLTCMEQYLGPYPVEQGGFRDVFRIPEDPASQDVLQTLGFQPEHVQALAKKWFGESLQAADPLAQKWLDALVAYAELLYVEYLYDRETATRYLFDQHTVPAGAAWLHGLRAQQSSDEVWWAILQGTVRAFGGKEVEGATLSRHFSQALQQDLDPQVAQYLLYGKPPTLQYDIIRQKRKTQLYYRWVADAEGFTMPAWFQVMGEPQVVSATQEWQKKEWKRVNPRQVAPVLEMGWVKVQRVDREEGTP